MSPALTNFLFEAANFLLLAAALGWLLFKPVRRALDAERETHDKDAAEDERLRAEAESLAKEARSAREASRREADAQRQAILVSAQREAGEIIQTSRKARIDERRRFERELAVRREGEAAELAEAVGRIAAESVRNLLGALDGPALDLALVRAARAELEAVPSEARGAAVVECARPLDAEARALLAGVLGSGFTERVVDELAAGVRVTTPAGQVDATAVSLARRAALALKSAEAAPDNVEVGDG